MAFSVGASNGLGGGIGGRRRFGGSSGTLSEINIVPLVDVVLVLLIIFMLTAHVMEFGMEINVPKTRETQTAAQDLPVINIKKNGQFFLGDRKVANINLLPSEIDKRFKGAKKAYVRADRDGIYDPVVQVIAVLGHAGIQPMLVTQPEK